MDSNLATPSRRARRAVLAALPAALALGGGCRGGPAPAPAPTPTDEPGPGGARAPAAEPADERIVFLRAGSVWMMKTDGSDAISLTVRPVDAPDESPALSPDGGAIAWASPQGGLHRVHVMSLDELIPHPITSGDDGGDSQPAWSPDGERIAFMRGDPRDRKDLYVVAAAGGEPELLLEGDDDEPEQSGAPAWSPDGRAIILSADRREGGGTTLWRFDLGEGSLTRLTRRGPGWIADLGPAFSPDGERIAFASNRHVTGGDRAADFDIYTVAADGSDLRRLTRGGATSRDPSFSFDGKRIYFASTRGRRRAFEWEIFVMSADGGQQRRLTRDESPQNQAPSAGVVSR